MLVRGVSGSKPMRLAGIPPMLVPIPWVPW